MTFVINKIQAFLRFIDPRTFKGDKWLWIILFLLGFFSILSVYSATYHLSYRLKDGSTEYFLMRHLSFWLVAVGIILFVQKIPLQRVLEWKGTPFLVWSGLALGGMLLVYTLFGTEGRNGANRWMNIAGFDIQTSDIAKLTLTTYLAYFMVSRRKTLDTLHTFMWLLIPVSIYCLLIFTQDLSTATLMAVVSFLTMIVGGVAYKYLVRLFFASIGVVASFVAFIMLFPDRFLPFDRFLTWKNRILKFAGGDNIAFEHNTQAAEARNAVINGSLTGVGLGKGVHKNNLTEIHTDFIYAAILEESGLLVGGIIIPLLFVALLYRASIIYRNSKNSFAGLLAIGLAIGICMQAFLHMAICVGIGPVTGIPLPMISMGGTSLIITSISIGLMLSASNKVRRKVSRTRISRSKNIQPRFVGQ